MRISQVALFLMSYVSITSAFWGHSHLLVARIANDLLAKESPDALAKANKILSTWTKNNDEGNYPFVESAPYADNIKGKGASAQAGWHFIDTPYFDEGGDLADWPKFHLDSQNITTAMTDLQAVLENKEGSKDSVYYQTVSDFMAKLGGTQDDINTIVLRLMIHYCGDIHQPLHTTSRVDKEYPAGDRGGNSFKVKNKETVNNLHMLYDSAFYAYDDDLKLPLSLDNWNLLGSESVDLLNRYPKSALPDLTTIDFLAWADEGSKIADDFTYLEINHMEGEAMPEDYVTKGVAMIEERIVLGGYRLKALIETMMASQKDELTFQEMAGILADMLMQ